MKAELKLAIGILILLAGIYLLLPRSLVANFGLPAFGYGRFLLPMLMGGIPLVLVIIGFLLAWVEWDEMQQQRAAKAAEKK